MKKLLKIIASGILLVIFSTAQADQVILDDLIVDGSACIGNDCVNGESFNFDTLRLKENNLRIKFQDTSNSGSFATNDWQITANDSGGGGANKFSIDDIDGGRTPFTIEAGAPTHSLYVDDGGRLGLGTSTPVVDVHIKSGNTPTLRLEQDGSSGFTPQTWDMGGNEANFFIRDATNGSTLPFRIFPGAPSNAINIEATTGDVGLGTTSPKAALEVRRSNGTAQILVDEQSGTTAKRSVFKGKNNGETAFVLKNTNTNNTWAFTNTGTSFTLSKQGSGVKEFEIFNNGDATLQGMLTELSDVNSKLNIEPVVGHNILKKLSQLEISEWSYKDAPKQRHLGPMSQDFYKVFGLGGDKKGISTMDSSGVALAAIKALIEDDRVLAEENIVMRERLNALERQQVEMQAVMMKVLENQQAQAVLTRTVIN